MLEGGQLKEAVMGKIVAGITTSVDGYITGPGDGPGCGLGVGGERLHYWVFGGPWSYESPGRGEATGEDLAYLDEAMGANGAVVAGRGTYEAAGHWGDANPWGLPFFIVTHRPADQPDGGEFTFTGSLDEAVEQARAAASRAGGFNGCDTVLTLLITWRQPWKARRWAARRSCLDESGTR